MKLQTALEYLMTHSWMILVVSIVLVSLAALGVFTNNLVGNSCAFPEGFSCAQINLASNGTLYLTLQQSFQYPVTITATGCNSNYTTATMANVINPPTNTYYVTVGSTRLIPIVCYSGASPYSGSLGSVFRGYVILNYTDQYTGYSATTFGQLIAVVSKH